MKDNFSGHSAQYSKYRPHYPEAFYLYLKQLIPERNHAWDCGTGNGQVAVALSSYFEKVEATDISGNQLSQASKRDNICYSQCPAEKVPFPDQSFDLITVGQAIHWFDMEAFYREAHRTLKPGGIIAIMGYDLIQVEGIQDLIQDFYVNVVGPYWDPERKYLDEKYATIPFPFKEQPAPCFEINLQWTLEQLYGYLNTWSAVKHYITANQKNPVDTLRNEVKKEVKKDQILRVKFPMLLRLGRNEKLLH
ncbi:class I SAM-dependent methyltransferase [Echinicola jeungdonensis]|uniref:Methyltransferase domain-containing protein n=1 Tax=Echinicola jeungdonensis TaxID=709343 RepID=A0ABV5J0N7_9BACT|nr:class I SAM-dependent methyltransferase [Echinicola jeungdonensis]MDN3667833.1 class I SAM-dependent methyltransferase [Echinicola jeungdonensis]